MASGTISVTTNNKYISGKISWSSTKDVTNNRSTVKATLYLSRTNAGYTTYGSGSFTINIGGSSKTNSDSFTFSYNSNTICVSHSATISHNADGTKSITISVSGGLPSTSFTATYGSGTAKLDTIPRASSPSVSASSVNYGSAVTIYTNRASTSFSHTLRYDWNGRTGTIASGVGDSVAWTVPNSFMDYIPNATSSWGTIYCDTYSGGTFIGTKTVKLTTSVPSGIIPSLSSITASDTSSVYGNLGAYVQNLSSIKFQINSASGTYSSSITAYEIVYDGRTYGSSNITVTPSSTGTFTATARVKDSRGRWSSSKSVSVTVSGYSVPKITSFTVTRCNSDGSANDMGTYAKITRNGSWSSFSGKNTVSITVQSKARTSSTWTTLESITSADTGGAISASYIKETYSETSSYDFLFTISDEFNTTTATTTVPTGAVTMSLGEIGVGIGKVWEQGALDVGGDIYANGTVTASSFHTGNTEYNSGNIELMAPKTPYIDFKNDTSIDYDGRIILSNDNELQVQGAILNCAVGVKGVGRTPAYTWSGSIPANSGVTITHNLGYEPLIQEDGTCGSVSLTFSLSGTTQAYVWNWSTSGVTWSGTIKFY